MLLIRHLFGNYDNREGCFFSEWISGFTAFHFIFKWVLGVGFQFFGGLFGFF